MDDSMYEDWDGSHPFNLPEEIDLGQHLTNQETKTEEPSSLDDDEPPLSIGDVLSANGHSPGPSLDPMNVSALKTEDDMAEDVDNDHQGRLKTIESDDEEEEEEAEKEAENVPAEEQEPEKSLEDQFNEVYDKIVNDPNADANLVKNLTLFMDGIRNARNAEKKVEEAYIATEKLFEKSKTTILESALPLYEYLATHLDQLETEILAHFSETHELRKSIVAKFAVLNKTFKQTYEDLVKRLVPGTHEVAMTISMPGFGDGSTTHHSEGENGEEVNSEEAENKMETDGPRDLDWDDIVSLCPALKDIIEKFMTGREEWSAAVDCFTKAADTADEKIGKQQQHMLEILANAHSTIYDNLAESREGLMRLFVDNHVKRATLEKHLQRKASAQTKFFQRLMQSVKGPGGHQSKQSAAASGTTTIELESAEAPSGQKSTTTRTKMSSIRKVFKIGGKGKKRPAESQDPRTES